MVVKSECGGEGTGDDHLSDLYLRLHVLVLRLLLLLVAGLILPRPLAAGGRERLLQRVLVVVEARRRVVVLDKQASAGARLDEPAAGSENGQEAG